MPLGELKDRTLEWYIENWDLDDKTGLRKNTPLRLALNAAEAELKLY